MKTPIILFSLAFIIITANSSPPIPDPVLDAYGKNLRAGVKYRVEPAYGDDYTGGLMLVHVGNKNCPSTVAQSRDMDKGLSVTFSPVNAKKGVIRVSTDVNIRFPGSNSCNESNVWRLKYNKDVERYAVMVGGVEGNPGPKTLYNWFKIEKSSYGGYKFFFCPSVCSYCKLKVECNDVNTFLLDRVDGQPLVLYNSTNFPFSFIFYPSI